MKRFVFLILLLCFCASALRSQTADQDDVIRVETDVTNLPFTAMDKQRRFITTLRAEDVRVLEDGVPQQLFTFQRETDRPLAIAFLIDVSRSQEFTPAGRESGGAIVYRESDSVEQRSGRDSSFHGLAYLEQGMTRDLLSVYRVLQRVEVAVPAYLGAGRPLTGIPTGPGLLAPPEEGTTAIWDAVALTSSNVLANAPGLRRRAIILLTDGLDTASRLMQKEAINANTCGGGRDLCDRHRQQAETEWIEVRCATWPNAQADARSFPIRNST